MAQETKPRPRVRCPLCDWAGPANKGGRCAREGCDGAPVAVPTNARRDPSGEPRVRMTVRTLKATAEALTPAEVAALADGHVAGSACGRVSYRRHIVHRDRCMDFGHMKGLEAADALDAFAAWVDRESPELGRLTGDKQVKVELDELDAWRANSDAAVKDGGQ